MGAASNDLRYHVGALRCAVHKEQPYAEDLATVSHVTCACCAKGDTRLLACCRPLLRLPNSLDDEWEFAFPYSRDACAGMSIAVCKAACQRESRKSERPEPRQVRASRRCKSRSDELRDGCSDLGEDCAVHRAVLLGLGVNHRLDRSLLPRLEIGEELLRRLRHASGEA